VPGGGSLGGRRRPGAAGLVAALGRLLWARPADQGAGRLGADRPASTGLAASRPAGLSPGVAYVAGVSGRGPGGGLPLVCPGVPTGPRLPGLLLLDAQRGPVRHPLRPRAAGLVLPARP